VVVALRVLAWRLTRRAFFLAQILTQYIAFFYCFIFIYCFISRAFLLYQTCQRYQQNASKEAE
jgi:hypothetical protein